MQDAVNDENDIPIEEQHSTSRATFIGHDKNWWKKSCFHNYISQSERTHILQAKSKEGGCGAWYR